MEIMLHKYQLDERCGSEMSRRSSRLNSPVFKSPRSNVKVRSGEYFDWFIMMLQILLDIVVATDRVGRVVSADGDRGIL